MGAVQVDVASRADRAAYRGLKPMRHLLLALLLLATPAHASSLKERLDAVVEKAVAEEVFVGGVVLIAKDGKVVYERAAGLADRETGAPVQLDTRFRLASMTKPVVTAAALSLVDAGVLGLDDPVTKWIPEFTPELPDGSQPTITLRQLMTHTAGLTNNYSEAKDPSFAWYGVDGGLANTGLSLEENTARIARVPLKFAPGSEWWYSYATDVLGDVIGRAAGKNLPEVVQERIAEPLGIASFEFTSSAPQKLATAYTEGNPPSVMTDGQVVRRITFHPSRALSDKTYPSGGAGLMGTAHDYFLFLEAIRKGGKPVLSEGITREFSTNQTGELPIRLMGAGWDWGLSTAILKDPVAAKSPASAGTLQWGGVYGTHFWVDPQAGITAVILTNTAMTGTVGNFPEAIRAEVYHSIAP